MTWVMMLSMYEETDNWFNDQMTCTHGFAMFMFLYVMMALYDTPWSCHGSTVWSRHLVLADDWDHVDKWFPPTNKTGGQYLFRTGVHPAFWQPHGMCNKVYWQCGHMYRTCQEPHEMHDVVAQGGYHTSQQVSEMHESIGSLALCVQ